MAERKQRVLLQHLDNTIILPKHVAIAAGLKVFRDGKLCARGHRAYRYICNRGCLECKKISVSKSNEISNK